jgi:hypothetical protein
MRPIHTRLFLLALASTAACGVDSPSATGELTEADLDADDVEGHWLLDHGIRLFADAESAQPVAAEAAAAAAAASHYHTIDWSATRPTHPYGRECQPAGPLMSQGQGFLMFNSGAGWSCAGEWMVAGRIGGDPPEYYRFIKIRSLNGH